MNPLHVVVVTGLSGSGKSTAINALEDLGFYCIDNLPAALVPRFAELCEGSSEMSRVGLGVDSRAREFLDEVPRALAEVRRRGHRVETLFLDASDDALIRRFSETRRPHPLAQEGDVGAAISLEREMLAGLRGQADRIVDTSGYNGHQLREAIRGLMGPEGGSTSLRVSVQSFGFKHGIPTDADLVFDVRFLPNPYYVEELRPQTGMDGPVSEYVLGRPAAQRFLTFVEDYLQFSLPEYEREGKSYLTLAIGCTGGRHRSVALVERVGQMLGDLGVEGAVRHRDVGR